MRILKSHKSVQSPERQTSEKLGECGAREVTKWYMCILMIINVHSTYGMIHVIY